MSIFLFLLFQLSFSKQLSTVISLTQKEPWKYVTKFAMGIGKGTWEIRAQLVSPIEAESSEYLSFIASVYIDTNWPDVFTLDTCLEKEEISNSKHILLIPVNGKWSSAYSGTAIQKTRPRFWYFSLSNSQLTKTHRVRVEIWLKNADSSEFSTEDNGLQYIYPCILLIYFFILFKTLVSLLDKFEKTITIEPSSLILNLAIFSQFGGILFEVIHLWIYSYNGKGIMLLELLYQSLELVSSIIVTVLLILIANGWTLKYRSFPDADIYIPISMIIIAVNLVIVALGKLSDDSYNKYTDYEGVAAFFIIVFRILSWLWFIFLIKELEKNANLKLLNFLFKFSIISTGYFLALPAVVIFSWVFEPYVRKIVVVLLINIIQIMIFSFLTHMFGEKSDFYKISTMSESVLPGGD